MSLWTTRAHHLLRAQSQQLAQILIDTDTEELRTYRTTAAGDERKLRGIPAIGRGVTGAQHGLRPGDDASKATARATTIGS